MGKLPAHYIHPRREFRNTFPALILERMDDLSSVPLAELRERAVAACRPHLVLVIDELDDDEPEIFPFGSYIAES